MGYVFEVRGKVLGREQSYGVSLAHVSKRQGEAYRVPIVDAIGRALKRKPISRGQLLDRQLVECLTISKFAERPSRGVRCG